jgi:antitoxin MazE
MYIFVERAIMQVAKWGNSLAIRIPSSVVEALELQEGDEIDVRLPANARAFEIERKPKPSDFLVRIRKFRGVVPADFKFDRQASNER